MYKGPFRGGLSREGRLGSLGGPFRAAIYYLEYT